MNKYQEAINLLKKCKLRNMLMEACIFNNISRCQIYLENEIEDTLTKFHECIEMYAEIYGSIEISEIMPIYENIS